MQPDFPALEDAKPLYFLPDDALAEEVLIPAFAEALSATCMVGFFSSASLADLAPGLATYIGNPTTSFRLIVSPYLTEVDQQAMQNGLRDPSELAAEFLGSVMITADDLQRHTLKCLAYLIAARRIEIRVALMRNGLFHPKAWMFQVPAGNVAVHGSSNMTGGGIRRNYEQIAIARSWSDPTQRYVVDKLSDRFERLWANRDNDCIIVDLPEAIRHRLLKDFPADSQPTEDGYRALFRRAAALAPSPPPVNEPIVATAPEFKIPSALRFDEGAFAHQGAATRAWVGAGFRGILEMATGSGKTVTSLLCAYQLYRQNSPLLIVVAAPYVPLIDQWCREICLFGLRPINLSSLGGLTERSNALQQLRRRLRQGGTDVEIVVVSHDTLCTPEFAKSIDQFECQKLLIADEVHNLGRASFLDDQSRGFQYRLGLSATPVRQYDVDGTARLFQYFGPTVFQYSLKDAIGHCLVEYDYFMHPVALSESEMSDWADLTATIRQNAWRHTDGKSDDYLAKLRRDRRLLLETASGKIDVLATMLAECDLTSMRHTLVYATDKNPQQLRAVNALLAKKGVLFHQLTAEETADRELTQRIIRLFQAGEIQVLTAKRVLDEGVNIPQICTAYILASTTVERQWIQRRGRLLRTCKELGKTHSVIHDFIALPPSLDTGLDDDEREVIKSELVRAREFASLARNAGRLDGALPVIHELVTAVLS